MGENRPLHNVITAAFRAEHKTWGTKLTEIGITQGQPKILEYIFKNDGCIQKDIAEGTGIEPSSATSILAVMEREGLVKREQSSEDRRRYHVFITAKGLKKREQIQKISHELSDKLMIDFSKEEIETLYHLLDRITVNAKRIVEETKDV